MSLDLPLLAGIIGMCFVFVGFFMIQTHRWTPDNTAYDVINVIGSGMLMYYAFVGGAWPFFILNAVFGLFSLKEVIADITRARKK